MDFQSLLAHARNGGGILFCGAGFSSDCLNFENIEEIGTTGALLELLNQKLEEEGHISGFRDIKNAADEYRDRIGQFDLMNLLKQNFSISHVTEELIEITKYPWERIYTTNYDNAIELACTHAKRPFDSRNNLDPGSDFPETRVDIVHLHGCAEKWEIRNFEQSCILGAESYMRLEGLKHWLDQLRTDVDRSTVVVFVGFSAQDFHLNQVLYNASGTKPKVFFVNRTTVQREPDLERMQRNFGQSLPIGRSVFSTIIRKSMHADVPREPVLRCYNRYHQPEPSPSIPSVTEIENQLIFGEFSRPQIVRDVLQGRKDYHVPRTITREILSSINNGTTIALLTGEICDGKTLVVEELCAHLSLSRPVFELRHAYDDILEETVEILDVYKTAVVIIENCFDLSRTKLRHIARQFHKSTAMAILTSRNIAAEAEAVSQTVLEEFESFGIFHLTRMDRVEIETFVELTDQIAAWKDFYATTYTERLRFVETSCRGSLPGFLLRLLRSKHVKERYVSEYRKTESLHPTETRAGIAALYVAHIGYDAPLSFLSNIFEIDVGAAFDRLNEQGVAFRLVRRVGDSIKTVPSIGATVLLKEVIEPREVVDTIVEILKKISALRANSDFVRHMFTQMMRYSILASVVDNAVQINRFFDNVSKIPYCRRQILFWLQWHMAMTDQRQFVAADRFLTQAYKEVRAYKQRTGIDYDSKQLDDRKAKFLMLRGRYSNRATSDVFSDFVAASRIVRHLLGRQDLTHHPFETLREVAELFGARSSELTKEQRESGCGILDGITVVAKNAMGSLPEGYQSRRAKQSLERVNEIKNW